MISRSTKILSFFLALLFVVSCLRQEETSKPDNLISEQNYIDLLVEMQHITTYRDARPNTVNADSLKSLVYDKFGITEEQFLASHQYYQKQVNRQIARVNEALRQMENEKQYIQAHIDSVKAIRKDSTEN